MYKSASRIDNFLLSNTLVSSCINCKIGPIALTDHATVMLDIMIGEAAVKSSRWRLNTSLFQDPVFKDMLGENIRFFFQINTGSTEKFSTVWGASKAFLRGKIIAYSNQKKKINSARVALLESQLKDKENQLSLNYSNSLLNEVYKFKFELNEVFNKKAEYALFRTKANFFENGDKASKLLARQLKQQDAAYIILGIRNEQGEVVTETSEINHTFQRFYSNLYSSETSMDAGKIEALFSKMELPQLSSHQAEVVDAPITEAEVRAAVQSMKVGKSPGIDGFPIEYYKHNIDLLAPILTELYSKARSLEGLPETFHEAFISLILKKDKDPLDPGSFRPVSLVNVDCKILTKILAMRLEKVLPLLVHSDQVGFVKGRSSSDNLWRLLHLMWLSHDKNVPVAAL